MIFLTTNKSYLPTDLTCGDNDEQTMQLIRSFLQHCMQNLSESITQVRLAFSQEALLTPDEMEARYEVLYRSLDVLFEHVRNIRHHYAYQLHLRNLEDEVCDSLDFPHAYVFFDRNV